MRRPMLTIAAAVVLCALLVASCGGGQKWTSIDTLSGGNPSDPLTAHTADFRVDGSVRATVTTRGLVDVYLMPKGAAPDDSTKGLSR